MSALPPTMRAWTYNSRGTPRSVLTLDNAFPTPPPPAGSDLLIRISHASVNPGTLVVLPLGVTLLLRRGSVPACIPELDFAGTVSLAGPAAPDKFKEGTRVFGSITPQSWEYLRRGAGTLAEFVLVQADAVAMMPDGLGMEEAGGLSGSGQTALKMCKVAGIKPLTRPRVLVNGGSGGVGTMVCQLARAMGASAVVATCSGGNVEMVKGLGVDEVIDYRAVGDLPTYLTDAYGNRPFDVILDTVGTNALYEQCPGYLKPKGTYINVGAFEGALWTIWCWTRNTLWPKLLGGTPRRYIMFSTAPNGESADKLAGLVEQGKLRVVVDSVFRMEDVVTAYDRMGSKRARGKIAIKIRDD